MNYNNTLEEKNQETKEIVFLTDKSKSGREREWKEKKMKSEVLSIIYNNLGKIYGEYYTSKAIRLEKCSNFLEFQFMNNGFKKLINGNFCRVRLCPMCGWRRSLKIYANMTKIMEHMKEYQFIFLTMTVKSCNPEELNQIITDMMKAWNLFVQYKDIKVINKGWYRGLEITHNIKKDIYHPHFHVVIAVNKSYFTGRDYIKQQQWCKLWKKSMKLDYDPIIDIRKVKGNTTKAISEIAKYTVKDKDYIDPEDLKMSEQAVKILDETLHKRRLVAFGGIMKELHKKLNLDDEVEGSLENIDKENEDDSKAIIKLTYAWNVGYRNYIKID